MKYYFTYGADEELQAYSGGWTLVEADSVDRAISAYDLYHERNKNGMRPFCDVYSEERFRQTGMFKRGENLGAGCHEFISLWRVQMYGSE